MIIVDLNQNINTLTECLVYNLLKDKTTGNNVLDTVFYTSYVSFPELTPRCLRNKVENDKRSKDKAEIFTPIRIVKEMNDMVIEEYNKKKSFIR